MVDPTLPQSDADLQKAMEMSLTRSRPPVEVPGYEAERFLGAGAYGEVWVAVDRNTGRKVAIKFYKHRGGLDWSLLSHEVEKLAFLTTDRYVVQLIEVGWTANPPFYVMEYLERGSLADRLREGALPVAEAVNMFRDVALGLVHAHGKGILHCDLKPANILLDQDWKPRLADFGQSRLSHDQTPALGTLFYMAPEQSDLQALPDAQWDVYALGALLYCMLTGSPPHRTEHTASLIEQSGGVEHQLASYRKLITESGTPRAHRSVPGVDRELAEIVERCLRVDPARRFANAQAVLDSLAERAARRARRPMLFLGLMGPMLFVTLAALFAWRSFNTAVEQSREAISTRALESNGFAAQFVAAHVAAQINHRWEVLESVAANPEFRRALAAATEAPRDSAARRDLQKAIERLPSQHAEIEASSWVVMNARGVQLAREPFEARTIDRNYSFRDYFHGQGRVLDANRTDIPPIDHVHLSQVFVSTANNLPKVAFSAPIFAEDAATVLGVLSITVELGQFAELRAGGAGSDDHQVAVLVDLKPDETLRPGRILEHPYIAALLPPEKAAMTGLYLERDRVGEFDDLRKMALKNYKPGSPVGAPLELSMADDYADTVGGQFAGRWLAAIQPVLVDGRHEDVADTGWAIVVQERYDQAIGPVGGLGDTLKTQGRWALAALVGLVLGLWLFVAVVFNEAPRGRWFGWWRRRGSVGGATMNSTASPTESRRAR